MLSKTAGATFSNWGARLALAEATRGSREILGTFAASSVEASRKLTRTGVLTTYFKAMDVRGWCGCPPSSEELRSKVKSRTRAGDARTRTSLTLSGPACELRVSILLFPIGSFLFRLSIGR